MLKLSARNQYTGTVIAVREGAVNGMVTIDLGSVLIKSDISMAAILEQGIVEGMQATAIVKASDVIFGLGTACYPITASNQYPGIIKAVKKGAVNGSVVMEASDGIVVTGSVANDDIDELGLAEGVEAVAVLKSTDVLIGLEG